MAKKEILQNVGEVSPSLQPPAAFSATPSSGGHPRNAPVDTPIEAPYVLPEGWKWCMLGDIAEIKTGKKDANYGSNDGLYPFFTCAAEPIKCNGYSFDCEAILLAGNGDISNISLYSGKFEAYQRTYVLQFNPSIDRKYVYYHLKLGWVDFNKDKMYGSTIPYIRLGNLKSYPIPFPPTLAEQQRIVNRVETMFAKLDEAKEKAQNVVDSFETRKAAILHKAFTGELTANWRKENNPEESSKYLEKIKDKVEIRLDFKYWENTKLPESWCESTIGNLLYFAGRVGWKGLKAEEYTSEGPILLSVYNLNDGDEVSFNKINHITNERYDESPEIMVRKNDILLTKDGAGIGKLGYVNELPEKATINSSLLLIRSGDVANYKFIFYLLSGPALQNIVKERITGSATPHLFQRDIKEFVLPVPSLAEQQEIVRILDSVLEKESRAKEATQTVLDQIALLKKSILARAFRGEL